jgi:ribonuclease-3
LIREALTAPSACRDYDYERLEFYGDSIIGFLVILELFLLNQKNTEGDLDFCRIERVSNENFYKINKDNKFFKYMIIDPHYVFSGFVPAGFDHFEQYSGSQLHY